MSTTLTRPAAPETDPRELAHRSGDGFDISLLWHEETDDLTVVVVDQRDGHAFTIDATRENALDVFHHPFAYARERDLPLERAA